MKIVTPFRIDLLYPVTKKNFPSENYSHNAITNFMKNVTAFHKNEINLNSALSA